jgi:hypothetical protein
MGTRKIIGVQLHHSVKLGDARRYGANLCSALEAAHRITDNPALLALHDQAQAVLREVSKAERDAHARLVEFQSHPDFGRMVDGALPWPDETLGGFEARCTCNDACPACDRVATAPTPESALTWAAEGHRGRCQPCARCDAQAEAA